MADINRGSATAADAAIIQAAFPGYASWNDPAAIAADYNATGGAGKGLAPISSPQDYGNNLIEQSVSKFQQLQQEANKKFGEYQQNNPFSFDEYLKGEATTMAKEQIDPFYNETLSDYLLGVDRKKTRSISNAQDLLGELSATTKSFTEDTQLKLTEALNKSREGFADTGLFESGQRYRQEGLLERGASDTLSDFGRKQALREKGYSTDLSRTLEDLSLGKKMDVRNLERERSTAVGVQAGQLAKEAGQNYVRGFQQTLPPELQANNNFDMLKQLGIYS